MGLMGRMGPMFLGRMRPERAEAVLLAPGFLLLALFSRAHPGRFD
jgi:hypothetical protein